MFWEGEGYLGVIKGIVLDMCVCVSMRERDTSSRGTGQE